MSRKERLWVEGTSAWLAGNGKVYREAMQKYLNEFPDDREGYFYIGLGRQWLDGDCNQAIQWYEKAYHLTPNYYPVTKAIVDCQLELKQNDRAVTSLQRYLKMVRSGHGYDQAAGALPS